MAIDDHEISNNWPGRNRPNAPAQQDATPTGQEQSRAEGDRDDQPEPDDQRERDDQRLLEELEIARESAFCYEVLATTGAAGKDKPLGYRLWYQFESAGLPFFVLDCRTQRVQRRRDVPSDDASMFGGEQGEAQCKALKEWLQAYRDTDQPKFIVSSIPIAPVLADHVRNPSLWRNADNWFGYPASLNWLAKLVIDARAKNTRNIVFLSGDYHFSATAQLWFFDSQCREASAYQIVASGLYAPMPFANERFEDYSWDRCEAAPIARTKSVVGFRASMLSNAQSHFVRVDVKKPGDSADKQWHVVVTAIGADGKKIREEPLF